MPLFDYAGQLQNGTTLDGTLRAESSARAEEILAGMGVRVTALRAANRRSFVAPLSVDDMVFLNDNIAAMARSGLPLDEGLRKLAAECGSSRLKRLILDVAEDLASGQPLEQSVARHARRFPTEYAGVIAAGIRTGDLGGSLYALSTQLRLRSDVRRIIWEVVAYPLTVLIFTATLMSLFMRFLVPQLLALRDEIIGFRRDIGVIPSSAEATFHNPALYRLWGVWPGVEMATLLAIVALIVLGFVLSLPASRRARESVLRILPGVSGIYRASILARFAHVCALGARTGTPLPELIAAGAAASGSRQLTEAAERVTARLNAGATLAEAAQNEPEIPALFSAVVSSSGSTGGLPGALQELALMYEQRAKQRAAALRIVFGPVLFLVVSSTIGGVIGSIMMLVVNLIQILTAIS